MLHSLKSFAFLGTVALAGLHADEASDHIKFVVELKMDCPPSRELQACMDSIPTRQSESFEEWRDSLVMNLKNLIALLESGKINAGAWSVQPDSPSNM